MNGTHAAGSRTESRRAAWACVALLLLAAAPTLAQVPRIQGQGTAASGMGNAFSAQADDPSAVHYNPAGMTQLSGVQLMFGGLLSGGTTSFVGPTGVTATGDRNGSVAWPPPVHAYLVASLKDLGLPRLEHVTAGIGLTVPFGSMTRWPENSPFRFVTTFNTLPLLDVKPTVAYRLTRDVSIGAGADIYTFSGLVGEGHVEQQSISPGGLAPPGQKLELSGKDTAAGFNVSVLYTVLRNASGQPVANVGFVYRSEATLELTGALSANGRKLADATSTLVLPRIMTGALAVWPVRSSAHEWKLEVDVDYVGWRSVQNLDVRLGNGTVIPQPQNWHSTYAVMAGTEVRWLALESLPGWEVAARTGYTHQPSQMPDLGFSPGVPSANAHIVAVGFGMLCKETARFLGLVSCGTVSKAIGVDLSYQASLYEDRTVAGNTGVRAGVNGLYKTTLHTGGLSIRMNF